VNPIHLAGDMSKRKAFVNTVMCLRTPKNVGKFLSSCTTGSFSTEARLQEGSWLVGGGIYVH
jgi:hypothetical protein